MSTKHENGSAADDELARSLNQLSLSAVTPSRCPSPQRRSPSMSTWPSTTRSSTPSLGRKTSATSLRSVSRAQRGRASSISAQSSEPERPPRPTAEAVARDHFTRELAVLHGGDAAAAAETVVVMHDSCYGHRYARPRTSRASLGTIVERPERIKACALGVAVAYVRLGERHQDGAHPPTGAPGPSVPFRIHRSWRRLALSSQAVTNVHGARWMEELTVMCKAAEAKLATNGKELQRPAMDRGPNADAPAKLHEGDLYLCSESLDALEGSLGGLCDAVDAVFGSQGPKRAFVAIRPPGHHCSASYPAGFCWINNVHVGIMHAILGHGLTHAAIIDFDLHHGDGSQSVAWEHNARGVGLAKKAAWWKKTSIGYFSLHDINSYPCEMGDEDKIKNASLCIERAHGQTVWNVHLQPWRTMGEFWALYESRYAVLLDKVRAYLRCETERLRAGGLKSKAAIFISAGFDASEWEDAGMQRHSVNVPTDFYARLTRDVVHLAADEGTSVEGRIISVLEGGYSDRALVSGVLSHLSGLAGDDPVGPGPRPHGRDTELSARAENLRTEYLRTEYLRTEHRRKDSQASERGARPYEAAWWSEAELDRLEATLNRPKAPVVEAKRRSPMYSSPTQASQARVASNPLRSRSSMSCLSASADSQRAPTPPPPPPPVSWTVAAHELSKLLVPTDRSTDSCKPEDLNAEATRARRDRQSVLAQSQASASASASASVTVSDRVPTRMALRERKPKPLVAEEEEEGHDEDDEPISRNRRKTLAGPVSKLPAPRQSSRRRSAASVVLEPEAPPPLPTVTSSSLMESGLPAGPVSTGLAVKKTRPEKKATATRVPQATKTSTTATAATTTTTTTTNTTTTTTTAGADGKTGDHLERATKPAAAATTTAAAGANGNTVDHLDALAEGVKKIKITLITPSMREERERAAREAARQRDAAATMTATTATSAEKTEVPLPENTQPRPPPADAHLADFSAAPTLPPPQPPTNGTYPMFLDGTYPDPPDDAISLYPRLPGPDQARAVYTPPASQQPATTPPATEPPAAAVNGLDTSPTPWSA